MSMLFANTQTEHLVTGIFYLVAGMFVMPLIAGGIVWYGKNMNATVGFDGAFFKNGWVVLSYFFVVTSIIGAVFGAVRLTILMSIKTGLINSPWSAA
ncbi:MAG: hypothetical protein HKO13_00300 [Sphingomonas sp.]|nr:hypothetical protein [Sphingomonas sp.]